MLRMSTEAKLAANEAKLISHNQNTTKGEKSKLSINIQRKSYTKSDSDEETWEQEITNEETNEANELLVKMNEVKAMNEILMTNDLSHKVQSIKLEKSETETENEACVTCEYPFKREKWDFCEESSDNIENVFYDENKVPELGVKSPRNMLSKIENPDNTNEIDQSVPAALQTPLTRNVKKARRPSRNSTRKSSSTNTPTGTPSIRKFFPSTDDDKPSSPMYRPPKKLRPSTDK